MISKKSIVLNGVESDKTKAILTVECDGYETTGKLRLYNFQSEPVGIISLGFNYEGKVIKAGLTRIENMLYSFHCEMKSLPTKFACAVINFRNGESNPILYGNSEGRDDLEKTLDNVVDALKQANSMSHVENMLDENEIDYDDALKEEYETEIDKCIGNCENCIYREYYFSHVNQQEEVKEENSDEESFYYEIKTQIDDIFKNNPTEEHLERLLPNSKWVKVKVDEEGHYYVLGLIYEDNKIQYICYGVPGVYQKSPPRQLSGYPFWFALEEENQQGFGYWLSYQDAKSGESVKATII